MSNFDQMGESVASAELSRQTEESCPSIRYGIGRGKFGLLSPPPQEQSVNIGEGHVDPPATALAMESIEAEQYFNRHIRRRS